MGISVVKFTFGPFQENTYIAHDGTACVIIDPGCSNRQEEQELVSVISDANLTPKAILLTHGHIDHVFGVPNRKYLWIEKTCGGRTLPFLCLLYTGTLSSSL